MIDLFVDHELSAELKQLGFNEECMAHWVKEGDNWNIYSSFNNFVGCQNSDGYLAAPIYEQALQFLESIHYLTKDFPYGKEDLRHEIFHAKDKVLKNEAFIEGEWYDVEYVLRNRENDIVRVEIRDDNQRVNSYYLDSKFLRNKLLQ